MSQPSVLIRTLAFILQALLAASDTAPQPALGAWRTARSTFFGADAWNVHQGGCVGVPQSPAQPQQPPLGLQQPVGGANVLQGAAATTPCTKVGGHAVCHRTQDSPAVRAQRRLSLLSGDSFRRCARARVDADEPLGWSVAALPDVDAAYPDSCGRCVGRARLISLARTQPTQTLAAGQGSAEMCAVGYFSCGRCLELACVNMPVTDGYNATVDRSAACYDTSASVIVRVTDTCPW